MLCINNLENSKNSNLKNRKHLNSKNNKYEFAFYLMLTFLKIMKSNWQEFLFQYHFQFFIFINVRTSIYFR